MPKTTKPKTAQQAVGWREWVALPDIGIDEIRAKIDTGARTSAIHAWNIERVERDGLPWLRFDIIPSTARGSRRVACLSPLVDERDIRNSGGAVERRFIIVTMLRLGGAEWTVELSLANRDEMGYRLLLGRTALSRRVIVKPGSSFLLGKPAQTIKIRQSGVSLRKVERRA